MSTRCTINFVEGDTHVAKVYRHSDGYPDGACGVPADLTKFFEDVELQAPGDTRFSDASYLAAKYVVWQADRYGRGDGMLNFLSVGILERDPGDIEFTYKVDCDNRDKDGRPTVTWRPFKE